MIFDVGYFFQFISQNNSQISFLFSSLDSRNGTYACLAFISGVERKNPSTRCGITAFLESVKKCLKKNLWHSMDPGTNLEILDTCRMDPQGMGCAGARWQLRSRTDAF